MSTSNLKRAMSRKHDEFYTLYGDVERELSFYPGVFDGKAVLCDCDTPASAFVRYFTDNFHRLGLRRLLACGLENGAGVRYEYDGMNKVVFPFPAYMGFDSFGGDVMIAECDIVVTNPPFSLFREWFDRVMMWERDFIVVGNINAVGYLNVAPHILSGKVRPGPGFNRPRSFRVPDHYPCSYIEDGVRYAKLGCCAWYTTLPHTGYDYLIPTEVYHPSRYPEYDNYGAIEVGRTKDMPCDYNGVMGLPITAVSRLDPELYELLYIWGDSDNSSAGIPSGTLFDGRIYRGPIVDGRPKFKRVLVRRRDERV